MSEQIYDQVLKGQRAEKQIYHQVMQIFILILLFQIKKRTFGGIPSLQK